MPTYEIALPKFNPKQQLAFDTKATDILFGGATRGGKSFWVRKSLIKWCSRIPGLQTDIFRLNNDDCIAEAMEGETSFPILLNNWERAGLVKINQTEITFLWNNSKISLEHASDPAAVKLKHQGIARHVRVFMEATQIDVGLIKWLSAWVTMTDEMKSRVPPEWAGCFPKIIHATNPIGVSAAHYRREYVKARAPYEIEQVGAFKRIYIPALVEDNPHEDAESTRQRIDALGDPALSDAMLNANWDSPFGDFFPQYSELPGGHLIPDLPLGGPEHLFRYMTFDWGSSDVAVVLWWLVSDGEPWNIDGETRWYPRGSLICYREWDIHYMGDPSKNIPENPDKGAQLRNEDIAKGIRARTPERTSGICLTDSLPFQDRGMTKHGNKYLIADEFKDNGVPLTLANTARIFGWKQVRDRLIGKDGLPLIYFCQSCKYVREYLPTLPRHPTNSEDAAEHGSATHRADPVRYACASKPLVKDAPRIIDPNFERVITPKSIISKLGVQKKSYGRHA